MKRAGGAARNARSVGSGLALALALCTTATGCAMTQDPSPAQSAGGGTQGALRERPTRRAMARAFERMGPEAARCLRAGQTATVSGTFDGESGEFVASSVSLTDASGSTYATETCLRAVAERARVRPFRTDEVTYTHVFAGPEGAPGGDAQGTTTAAAPAQPASAQPPSTTTSAQTAVANGMPTAPSMVIPVAATPLELVRRESDALHRCYEQAFQRDTTLAGRIELRMSLDAAGALVRFATRVNAQSQHAPLMELVARCIEGHVRLIAFGPQATPSSEVVIPLAFDRRGIPVE